MLETIQTLLQQPIVLGNVLPAIATLALLAFAIWSLSRADGPKEPRAEVKRTPLTDLLAAALGVPRASPTAKTGLVLITFAYGLIFAFALVIALTVLGSLLFGDLPDPVDALQPRERFAFGNLLAAILGAPFIIWRSWIAAKQTAVAEESLFNDKFNAAATDLAARRQVTRAIAPGGSYRHHQDVWEDDLVTRAAAIDRLEGLAKEPADVAPRIARMLSIYVQELRRAHPPRAAPEGATPENLSAWAGTHTPIRPDMERAVQSLGRINPLDEAARATFDPMNIDLRKCNLQSFDLHDLNFQGVQMNAATT